MNLFYTYVCTTILITVLLQADLFGISFKQFAGLFLAEDSVYLTNLNSLGSYDDMVANWYIDIGYKIWFTWLILAFSVHSFWPILQFFKEKLG